MTTGIVHHDSFGAHEVPRGHPERPERYRAVTDALDAEAFARLPRLVAEPADRAPIERVHVKDYVEAIFAAAPKEGLAALDSDTVMGPSSLDAALRGAGGAMMAVDRVMGGEWTNAFVASRPPGHHATPDRAMGFCLFNNVAIAAHHARDSHGAGRVAVLDFDVHHGNGTQDMFWDEADLLYASSHEWPQFPGTGRATDRGTHGTIHNVPLSVAAGREGFRAAWTGTLLPAVRDFAPDLVIVSAGFDAHADDPLGGLDLTDADFAWITKEIRDLAADVCGGRIVSVLEGGYDLGALARSAGEHVKALASADASR